MVGGCDAIDALAMLPRNTRMPMSAKLIECLNRQVSDQVTLM